jgi:hypothetical protein
VKKTGCCPVAFQSSLLSLYLINVNVPSHDLFFVWISLTKILYAFLILCSCVCITDVILFSFRPMLNLYCSFGWKINSTLTHTKMKVKLSLYVELFENRSGVLGGCVFLPIILLRKKYLEWNTCIYHEVLQQVSNCVPFATRQMSVWPTTHFSWSLGLQLTTAVICCLI